MAPSAIDVTMQSSQPSDAIKKASGEAILPDYIVPLRPTPADTPMSEICRRYEEDGYVWMKGLLPTADVWRTRKTYFEFIGPTGLIKEGTDPKDGIYCGGDWRNWVAPGPFRESLNLQNSNLEYQKRMVEAHAAPWYMAFASHPVLLNFIKDFTGWEKTTPLKRSIFRPNVKGGEPTGIHYDQIFLRGGPPTALTAWVPLGDCAINGGGLMYLNDSVSIGEKIEKDFAEAAKDFTDEQRISAFNAHMMSGGFLSKDLSEFSKKWGRKWLAANYEAGDVVFHKAFNIHASAVNESDVIRLATDLRYVEIEKPYDERWMKNWKPDDNL
ncbi:hypothetical protein HYFRA_00005908 [Hymenoscyphus fraxineus]|uniref:Phytanoyl-CoA dioxygenase n=1 Tax=Hymenoscyphus fraxineus TaxID=746836 RepID=A0A9N9KYF7_9HELO|nr:hypothetical protein HYFRA_00005908 [Hymenoscyphus fraxineus]